MTKLSRRNIIHSVPMLRIAVVFVIGLVVGDMLNLTIFASRITLAVTLFLTLLLSLVRRNSFELIASILTLLCIAEAGVWRMTECKRSEQHIPSTCSCCGESKWKKVNASLCVAGPASVKEKSVVLDAIVCSTDSGCRTACEAIGGEKVRLSVRRGHNVLEGRELHAGDMLRVTMIVLSAEHNDKDNAGFRRWMLARGYVCSSFATDVHTVNDGYDTADLSLTHRAEVTAGILREKAVSFFKAAGVDGDNLALVSAMSLGDKSRLREELREEYSDAGAAHILALSGMHLSVVVMFLSMAVRRRRWWHSCVMLALVWCYVLLAGVPASMVRAASMLSIWEAVYLMQREQHSLNVFGCALFVMVAVSPYSLWDIGFQMSYMAVLGIIVFSRRLNCFLSFKVYDRLYGMHDVNIRMRTIRYFWELGCVSLSAQVATAPLSAYYFGQLPSYFLITNMIVVPGATAIIFLSIFTLLLSVSAVTISNLLLFPALLSGKVLSVVAYIQNQAMHFVSLLPYSSISVSLSLIQVIASYVILLCLAKLMSGRHGRDY